MSKIEQLIKELCPNGVEYNNLGELGVFLGGITGKSKEDFTNGNSKFITYKNIYSNPSLKIDVEDKVRIFEGEKQNTLEYGDVLFTGSSETPEECGISSVLTIKTDEELFLNSFCFIFRFNNKSLMIPNFSKHLFRSPELRYKIIKTANGVTRFNISKKLMNKIKIPIPPLQVQREIVRILDTFSEYTTELTTELTMRKKQYEYYRDNLFSFDSCEYEQRLLGEIGEVRMCKRILKEQTLDIGDIPFYKIGTFGKEANAYISQELFEEYKSKYNYPKIGDVLISASGTIGRTVVFDGKDAYFQDSNIVWIENDESIVLNKYLFHFYKIAKWYIAEGGTIQRLYNDNLKKTNILVPYPNDKEKSLTEQQRIVDILDRCDTLCNDISKGLPAEIESRQKQYEYYRDKLLSFKEIS